MSGVTYMTEVCGKSSPDWAFWNSSITWDTDTPDFTACFKKTILQWIPCGYLWIAAIFYFPILLKRKSSYLRHPSKFNFLKMFLSLLLLVFGIIDLVKSIREGIVDSSKVPPALYINPIVDIISMIIVTVLIRLEFRKGIHSSGTIFLFWFSQFICQLFILISECLRLSKGASENFEVAMGIISFIVISLQLFAHCFAESGFHYNYNRSRGPYDERKPLLNSSSSSSSEGSSSKKKKILKTCPELEASFLARFTFTWITGLIIRGYRRALTSSDVWDLRPEESCASIVPRVEQAWHNQLIKSSLNIQKERRKGSTYLFQNGSHKSSKSEQDGAFIMMQEVQSMKKTPDAKKYTPSLFKTLRNVFGPYYAFAGFLKLITDLLNFVQPQLLNLLIDFVSGSEIEWHGYMFALALFLIAMLRTMIFQQYWHIC